jgi:hypothetical protein
VSPTQSSAEELKLQDATGTEAPAAECRETTGVTVAKRKYRRHPKVRPTSRNVGICNSRDSALTW